MWGASVRTSESIKELAGALAKAQAAVSQGAKKDVDNPFFKSKYADLASSGVDAASRLTPKGFASSRRPCRARRMRLSW
jgi:hypothetical protein